MRNIGIWRWEMRVVNERMIDLGVLFYFVLNILYHGMEGFCWGVFWGVLI